jgi:hypothetical protein
MPICITCTTTVSHLYTTYSKADDRSLGKGVRLTQCPRCKRFADKYVEHDFVVLFIDLVLIKPQVSPSSPSHHARPNITLQVYRHLLFNRLGRSDDRLDPSILRLGTFLLLFDVYLTWARIEKQTPDHASIAPAQWLSTSPILFQYLFFLSLSAVATVAQHLIVRLLVKYFLTTSSNPPKSPSPPSLTTALLVSSTPQLFPLLLVIWPPSSTASHSHALTSRFTNYAVLINNIEALRILLEHCELQYGSPPDVVGDVSYGRFGGYLGATLVAVAGMAGRWMIEEIVLSVVGLGDGGGRGGPVGDLVGGILWLWKRTGW